MRPLSRTASGSAAALCVLLAACGGGDGGSGSPVTPPPTPRVTTVTVTAPSPTLTVGGKLQLGATALDQSGKPMSGLAAIWSSSAPTVASVNASTGEVTGVAPGIATITATIAGVAGSATLAVSATPAAKDSVFMLPQSFAPPFLTIKQHEAVAFVFDRQIQHNVIFRQAAGAPADIPITTNRVVNRVFDRTGVFVFDCTVHPGMTGQITVQ